MGTQAARPALGTPTSTQLLAALDALTSDRGTRLAAASRNLPALYVITLAVSGRALIANASVLTIRARWRAAILVGGLAVVVGLSMALLFALGTPVAGLDHGQRPPDRHSRHRHLQRLLPSLDGRKNRPAGR